MTDPVRFTLAYYKCQVSFKSDQDPRGDWIFDPDHKIDISKFQSQAQPEDSTDFCKCDNPDNDMPPFGDHCLVCNRKIRT